MILSGVLTRRTRAGVPNPDTHGNNIACHIFVPFGGMRHPRWQDRIIVKVSPDERVHEIPIIQ